MPGRKETTPALRVGMSTTRQNLTIGRDDEFEAYLSSVRARHKAKRNFVKLIDGIRFESRR